MCQKSLRRRDLARQPGRELGDRGLPIAGIAADWSAAEGSSDGERTSDYRRCHPGNEEQGYRRRCGHNGTGREELFAQGLRQARRLRSTRTGAVLHASWTVGSFAQGPCTTTAGTRSTAVRRWNRFTILASLHHSPCYNLPSPKRRRSTALVRVATRWRRANMKG